MTPKTYLITTYIEDGKLKMKRVNDGFNSIELLGILQMATIEILNQIQGKIKPDIIERRVIVDKKEPSTPC